MTSPRYPGRDLRLERLNDREGLRTAPLGETAHVGAPLAPSATGDFMAAYQALIDAVFTAPGATEWLLSLKMAVAALVKGKEASPRDKVSRDAIQCGTGPDHG